MQTVVAEDSVWSRMNLAKMKSLNTSDNKQFKNQQECTKEIVSKAWF